MTEAEFVTSIKQLRPRKGDVLVIRFPRDCATNRVHGSHLHLPDWPASIPVLMIGADVHVELQQIKPRYSFPSFPWEWVKRPCVRCKAPTRVRHPGPEADGIIQVLCPRHRKAHEKRMDKRSATVMKTSGIPATFKLALTHKVPPPPTPPRQRDRQHRPRKHGR